MRLTPHLDRDLRAGAWRRWFGPGVLFLSVHCASAPSSTTSDSPSADPTNGVAVPSGSTGTPGDTAPDGGTTLPPEASDAASPSTPAPPYTADASPPLDSGTASPGPHSSLPTTFTLQRLDLTSHPDAVCNDGTAAGYYAQAGSSPEAPWVILLEGGSWCTSDADCAGRSAALSSSTGWGATEATPANGLLSDSATANPHFAGANRIDVPYCTSDVFSGTAPPAGGKTRFSFQGRAVFEAIIADLKTRYGLGAAGQSVLLAGVSAGGVSVLINADRLAADLPGVTVRALVDAGFLPDVAPLVGPSILSQFETGIAYWKGSPDEACAAANTDQPARCYLAQYVQPGLKTPVFFGQSLEDPHGPLHAGGFTLPANPTAAQLDWVNQVYTPTMIQLLGGLPPAVGGFSPCQVIHTMADNAAWTSLVVATVHYDDEVFAWWGGGSGDRVLATPCSLK